MRKKKTNNSGATVIIVVMAIAFVGLMFYKDRLDRKAYEYSSTQRYIVERGDTLWEIAERITPSDRQDPRQVIYIIEQETKRLTGVKVQSILQVGDTLYLPVFDCEEVIR